MCATSQIVTLTKKKNFHQLNNLKWTRQIDLPEELSQTEILLGDRAKVQAKAGLWVAALGVGLKDSGLSVTTTQAGAIFKISQDFDGRTQMSECLNYISSAKEVADFRDQNKADLVAGILEGDPSGAGMVGLAWLLPCFPNYNVA